MDSITQRLAKHYGLGLRTATRLVEAGLTTPKLIKAASDADLLALPNIGQTAVQDIRERIG